MPSIQAQGQFSSQKVIISMSFVTYYPTFVYSADFDSDGDMDVLSASYWDNKIAWYENIMGSTGIKKNDAKPVKFSLHQNDPNPFNPKTKIQYSIPAYGHVELKLYGVLGNRIYVPRIWYGL